MNLPPPPVMGKMTDRRVFFSRRFSKGTTPARNGAAFLLASLLFLSTVWGQGRNPNPDPFPSDEIIPTAIHYDGEVFSPDFAVEKMVDSNRETYACLLDESRTGSNEKASPPKGDIPVTARLVFDLGESAKTVGVRLVARNDWQVMMAKNVSVFAADDALGQSGLRPLAEKVALPPVNRSFSAFVLWPEAETRYVVLQVNDAFTLRDRRTPKVYQGIYFNTQIAEIRFLRERPDDLAVANPPDLAFPEARLRRDWIYQDVGKAGVRDDSFNIASIFTSAESAEVEVALVDRVLAELAEAENESVESFRSEKKTLLDEKAPGKDSRWKSLYFRACQARRADRLANVADFADRIVYVTHYVMGGTEGLTGMPALSDEQHYDATTERRPGSRLAILTIHGDGTVENEVLLDKPNGLIRDPALSFDAGTLVFSMRENFEDDDYHLYRLLLESRELTQLTFSPVIDGKKRPVADMEPCFAPVAFKNVESPAPYQLIFSSTRSTQINDCWPNANTNLYACDADGKNIRRLSFDELDVNNPQLLDDGRILFTRWEYSDRNAFFLHPLMTMNPDGSMQTEYCGNNSMYPASYIQARGVPGSTKAIAIISGHHVFHKGKLALIDRSLGTQDGACVEYVAGASPDGTPGRKQSDIKPEGHHDWDYDFFGQEGPQFQYPFALDEENYLVSFAPDMVTQRQGNGYRPDIGPFLPPFGVYWMNADGRRELLAFDPTISSGQAIPIQKRAIPTVKPTTVDRSKNYGTYIIQDIYLGPGLAGIERGTVKRLRVVALEYRAGKMGKGTNAGEVASGLVQTPISFNNGSWDVKHLLGEVDIESDGSCAFDVPARTPVYFQLLDEKGYCVQTMRSWSTLQPGEKFACLGCHENKNETGQMEQNRPAPEALKRAPQKLRPILGERHPLLERLDKESAYDRVENYYGVNAPALDADANAPVAGFSYRQEIQPILDRHCVVCHSPDGAAPEGKRSTFDLSGVYVPVEDQKVSPDDDYKRRFTRSYLTLTNNGKVKGNRFLEWLETRSRSAMLPPYFTGSAKSSLFDYLEPSHYGVKVSAEEKRLIACWIDLLIPFCGGYMDANRWTDAEKTDYLYFLEKRRVLATEEMKNLK